MIKHFLHVNGACKPLRISAYAVINNFLNNMQAMSFRMRLFNVKPDLHDKNKCHYVSNTKISTILPNRQDRVISGYDAANVSSNVVDFSRGIMVAMCHYSGCDHD